MYAILFVLSRALLFKEIKCFTSTKLVAQRQTQAGLVPNGVNQTHLVLDIYVSFKDKNSLRFDNIIQKTRSIWSITLLKNSFFSIPDSILVYITWPLAVLSTSKSRLLTFPYLISLNKWIISPQILISCRVKMCQYRIVVQSRQTLNNPCRPVLNFVIVK